VRKVRAEARTTGNTRGTAPESPRLRIAEDRSTTKSPVPTIEDAAGRRFFRATSPFAPLEGTEAEVERVHESPLSVEFGDVRVHVPDADLIEPVREAFDAICATAIARRDERRDTLVAESQNIQALKWALRNDGADSSLARPRLLAVGGGFASMIERTDRQWTVEGAREALEVRSAALENALGSVSIDVAGSGKSAASMWFVRDEHQDALKHQRTALYQGNQMRTEVVLSEDDLRAGANASTHRELYRLLDRVLLADEVREEIDSIYQRVSGANGPFPDPTAIDRGDFLAAAGELFEGDAGPDGRRWLDENLPDLAKLIARETGRDGARPPKGETKATLWSVRLGKKLQPSRPKGSGSVADPKSSAAASPAAQRRKLLEPARELLGILKQDPGRMSRYSPESIAAMTGYYPNTLIGGRRLVQKAPDLVEAVEAFSHVISAPLENRGAIIGALGLDGLRAEKAGEIGCQARGTPKDAWAALEEGKVDLSLADGAVEALFASAGSPWPKDLNAAIGAFEGAARTEAARIYARAIEKHLAGVAVSDLKTIADALPNDEASARVFYRLLNALKVPAEGVEFHLVPVTKYPVSGASGSRWFDEGDESDARAKKKLKFGDLDALLRAIDTRALRVDECSDDEVKEIHRILETERVQTMAGLGGPMIGWGANDKHDLRPAMKIWARAADMKRPTRLSFSDAHAMPLETPGDAVLLGRMLRGFGQQIGFRDLSLDRRPITGWCETADRFRSQPEIGVRAANLTARAFLSHESTREDHLAAFDLWYVRPHQKELAIYLSELPWTLERDPELMDRLARLLQSKAGEALDPHELRIAGVALDAYGPYLEAVRRFKAQPSDEVAVLPPRRRAIPVSTEPLGKAHFETREEILEAIANEDPRVWQMDDDSVRLLAWRPVERDGKPCREWGQDWLHLDGDLYRPREALIYARSLEIGDPTSALHQEQLDGIRRYFSFGHPITEYAVYDRDRRMALGTKEGRREPQLLNMIRVANAAGVPYDQVRVTRPNDTQIIGVQTDIPLPDWSEFPKPEEVANEQRARLLADLAKLDGAKNVAPAARMKALERLLSKGSFAHEFSELLGFGLDGRVEGVIEPLAFPNRAAESAFAKKVLEDWGSIPAASVLLGLFTQISSDTLRAVLAETSKSDAHAKKWSGIAEAFQKASGRRLQYLAEPLFDSRWSPSFSELELRRELVFETPTTARLERLRDAIASRDPTMFVDALVERAMAAQPGSAPYERIAEFLAASAKDGSIDPEIVRSRCLHAGFVPEDNEGAMKAAIQRCLGAKPADKPDAFDAVLESIRAAAAFTDPADLVQRAMGALYEADLAKVVPLKDAKKMLGKSVAQVKPQLPPVKNPLPPEIPVAQIGQTIVKKHDDPDKDWSAVPTLDEADIVLCATTNDALSRTLDCWKTSNPGWLEGDPSTGKTALLAYICAKTETPYRRINGSAGMTVRDLMGRMAQGEKRWEARDLAPLSQGELRRIGYDYGINGWNMKRDDLIEKILATQEKPHFCYGPVPRAWLEGECLVIDEALNIKPGVIESLVSLFDNRRNITLEENNLEVLKGHKNARIFFTTNKDLEGRFTRSQAMATRVSHIPVYRYTIDDLTQIANERFPDLPASVRACAVTVHDRLSTLGDEGGLGEAVGGAAYTPRDLIKVCDRVRFFVAKDRKLAKDADRLASLVRQEIQEVYREGLPDPVDLAKIDGVLDVAAPCANTDFYSNLELEITKNKFRIGNVELDLTNSDHALVPGDEAALIETPRMKEYLYKVAKAIMLGENVWLWGEAAGGKTALSEWIAQILKKPYMSTVSHANTQNKDLIGAFHADGWHDGPILLMNKLKGLLLIDEYPKLNPKVSERLNSVWDHERSLTPTEGSGAKRIRLDKDAIRMVAGNPPTERYGGVVLHTVAERSRFTHFWIKTPDDAECELIVHKKAERMKLPKSIADATMTVHRWAKDQYEKKDLGKDMDEAPDLSIRELMRVLDSVAKLRNDYNEDLHTAFVSGVRQSYVKSPVREDKDKIVAYAEEMRV
jgi:MoxR-like ATPase